MNQAYQGKNLLTNGRPRPHNCFVVALIQPHTPEKEAENLARFPHQRFKTSEGQ